MRVTRRYDVLVVGGGVAGVAAALEAARSGAHVGLIEKTVLFGGLATSGLILIYLPLCDGNGRQVSFGLAEELLHASMKYGPGRVPDWRQGRKAREKDRYRIVFSPASFVLALDELLEEAGVEVWLDTLFCTPVMEAQRVAGVEVENKSGRLRLEAACVVDATGDADVAHRAGAACASGGNWLSYWALGLSLEQAQQAVKDGSAEALLRCVPVGSNSMGGGHPRETSPFDGTDGRQVSGFVMQGRRLLREHYRRRSVADPVQSRLNCFPITLPSMAQFRMTRRIIGRHVMRDGEDGLEHPSSIGMVADWRRSGPVWEVPYQALLPAEVTGLLAAGRCMSSSGDAWDVMRVIPAAALTGQAAGLAAALSVRHNLLPDQLEVRVLQQHLRERGVKLHLGEAGLSPKVPLAS